MSDLRTDYMNDILAAEMNGKRRFKLFKPDGSTEIVSIEDVTEYEQLGSFFGAGDLNKTNQGVNQINRRPVNNNLLINSNFANPVNQRQYDGTVTDTSIYTIDRWKLNAGQAFDLDANGITFKPHSTTCYFVQRIKANELKGKKVILSMKINGKVHSLSAVVSEENSNNSMTIDGAIAMNFNYDSSNDIIAVDLSINAGSTPTVEWAKLELGEVATPYVPRLFTEELNLCKRFFQKLHKIGIIQVKLNGGNRLRIMVNYDNELTGASGNVPTPIIKSVRALSDDGLSTIVTSEISEYGREQAYCIFVATFDKNVYEGNLGGVQVFMEVDNEL